MTISNIFTNMMEHSKLKMVESLILERATLSGESIVTATYNDLETALARGRMVYLSLVNYSELYHMSNYEATFREDAGAYSANTPFEVLKKEGK